MAIKQLTAVCSAVTVFVYLYSLWQNNHKTDKREFEGECFMQVQLGKNSDIDEWMKLVKEISWNFPGLETQEKIAEHRETVLRFISKEQALCVKEGTKVIGVLLFSRKRNMICCLGVSPEHRRRGIASKLIGKALENLDSAKDITVSTFREEDEMGLAPRSLYKNFGFVEDELIEEFGYPNQKFILHP